MNWEKWFSTNSRERWNMLQKENRLSYDHVEDWILSVRDWIIKASSEWIKKEHHPEGFLEGSECEKCHELVNHVRKDLINEMMTKHKISESMKVVPENISTEKMFSFAESYAEMKMNHVLDELEKWTKAQKKDIIIGKHILNASAIIQINKLEEKLSELRKNEQ